MPVSRNRETGRHRVIRSPRFAEHRNENCASSLAGRGYSLRSRRVGELSLLSNIREPQATKAEKENWPTVNERNPEFSPEPRQSGESSAR